MVVEIIVGFFLYPEKLRKMNPIFDEHMFFNWVGSTTNEKKFRFFADLFDSFQMRGWKILQGPGYLSHQSWEVRNSINSKVPPTGEQIFKTVLILCGITRWVSSKQQRARRRRRRNEDDDDNDDDDDDDDDHNNNTSNNNNNNNDNNNNRNRNHNHNHNCNHLIKSFKNFNNLRTCFKDFMLRNPFMQPLTLGSQHTPQNLWIRIDWMFQTRLDLLPKGSFRSSLRTLRMSRTIFFPKPRGMPLTLQP